MIYTFNENTKYENGERRVKQISVNVKNCKTYELESDYTHNSAFCENHILILINSGILSINNEEIPEGYIIYISKFSSYSLKCISKASVTEISFEYSDNIPLFNEPLKVLESPIEAKNYMEKIYTAKFFKNSLPGVKEGMLINLLNILNSLCDVHKAELDIFRICREWIEKNAHSYITAQDVANALNYTPAHLNRIVKKHSNKCLSELISEARISKIKQLIRYTKYKTKEIAVKTGFESPELLRKYFKYHTGMSLKNYKSLKFYPES
ncbi:MAG: helix-turn-helix transcriptional regulator [Clostridia bacterium]|nr:helix-turn-helix transcriptional regulator [Clostridia bacterium]